MAYESLNAHRMGKHLLLGRAAMEIAMFLCRITVAATQQHFAAGIRAKIR
jgi:hypothetical protein